MSVYLLATLDTKGAEAALVRDRLGALGVEVTVVDTGCLGEPAFAGDITREQVFQAARTSLESLCQRRDRGAAVTQAAAGAAALVRAAFAQGRVDGVLALGGSAGTTIGTAAMRSAAPGRAQADGQHAGLGPSPAVRRRQGHSDVQFRRRYRRDQSHQPQHPERRRRGDGGHGAEPSPGFRRRPPLVAATMFGVTTPCVQRARAILEEAGYEVLVFHATGNGGQAMESLIAEGVIAGVLDITTTELADELVGGILSAGPDV